MAVNPEGTGTSIIAILIGIENPPGPEAPPEAGRAFGAAIKGHILGSESELNFGQGLTDLLGVHPDHGVF